LQQNKKIIMGTFVLVILGFAILMVFMSVKSIPQGEEVYRRAFWALHKHTKAWAEHYHAYYR
jgi:hypothetical protein